VDMACHRLSLEKNIPTIVVLWWWLRYLWQAGRHAFFQKVIDAGWLILSEFKLDMKPTNYSFPQRNRIVAWLADVVCVPEAREGSGSLITVDFALGMKKPIYGAPNSILSTQSAGLFPYLASGEVKLLYDMDLVLAKHFVLHDAKAIHTQLSIDLDPIQQSILALCMDGSISLEMLMHKVDLPMSAALEALTMLEMYGLVFQPNPGEYQYAQRIAK
jgi:DNA processing protein